MRLWASPTLWFSIRRRGVNYRFVNQALELVSQATLRLPKSGADLEFPAGELFAELDDE